ncbi:MAG TPA: amidohydrolase family protein [Gemmatimonadaceae bacterium]|nr:amidohydrolase family protein [Gemmatimonadaceae bacterium]
MKRKLVILPLGVLLVASGSVAAQERGAGTVTVFTNVNVIPMDRERVLAGQSVVVERGVIMRIGPGSGVAIPGGATVVDGTGKYLIPGLVDVHVHLSYNTLAEQQQILTMFVANGVTTVVNLRGSAQVLDLRSAVAAGRTLGPRIYSAGPYVNEPFFTTPDEVERAVVEQKRAGYDFIKLHGSLSRAAYARLNAVARREGIRVVGHAPRNLGIEPMFTEHQYMLAHAEEFLYDTTNSSTDASLPRIDSLIPEFARSTARAGMWVSPNLTGFKSIGRMADNLDAVLARPEMKYLPRSNQIGWGPATNPYTARFGKSAVPGILARYRLLEKMVREFHAAGVRLLIGTDAMNTGVVPGWSAHDELEDLVAAGLSPFDALRAATSNAAEFLGEPGDKGTIAVGQKADLVLLDANPLTDIANSRKIAGVMLRGRWMSGADIASMLREISSGSN